MTTFNWTILTLEYDLTEKNSVITAHWRCTATDDAGEFSAGSYGTCGFSADPEATDFVPYADLTEEIRNISRLRFRRYGHRYAEIIRLEQNRGSIRQSNPRTANHNRSAYCAH